jgi:3-oxoacyl-[acyl-carrier protein] reductase
MHQPAREALVKTIPLGRIGEPHDVWLGVKFIIENDYFTGRCIDIDGGLHML